MLGNALRNKNKIAANQQVPEGL